MIYRGNDKERRSIQRKELKFEEFGCSMGTTALLITLTISQRLFIEYMIFQINSYETI